MARSSFVCAGVVHVLARVADHQQVVGDWVASRRGACRGSRRTPAPSAKRLRDRARQRRRAPTQHGAVLVAILDRAEAEQRARS